MSTLQNVNDYPATRSGSQEPVWWLVFKREFLDLWVGGRAFNLLIIFSVLVSITAFLLANNSELNLTPPKQMEAILLQAVITFGLFIGLIVSAESISGERERATLETLLLTPTSRREIIAGKFLAGLTPWLAALVVGIPYMAQLSKGEPVLWPAFFWGALVGTLLAVTFTALGILVSIWSATNRNSLFICLLIYLLCLLPSQLPGEVFQTAAGDFFRAAGPLEAGEQFLDGILVLDQPVSAVGYLLAVCVGCAVLAAGVLFFYAAPRLQLDSNRRFGNLWSFFSRSTEANR